MRATIGQRTTSKSILVWVVELFSLVTAVSFVAAASFHAIVFWFWNLDFFALASPSDVLMSGLAMLIRTPPILIVGWCYFKYPQLHHPRAALAVIVTFSCLWAFLWWATLRFTWDWPAQSHLVHYTNLYAPHPNYLTCCLAAAAAGTWFNKSPKVNLGRPLVFTIVAGVATVAGFCLFVAMIVEKGFLPRGVTVAGNAFGACTPSPVLWMGERAIVARCYDGTRVLYQFEDVRITARQEGPISRSEGVSGAANLRKAEIVAKGQYQIERIKEEERLRLLAWRRAEEARLNAESGQNFSIAGNLPDTPKRSEWND